MQQLPGRLEGARKRIAVLRVLRAKAEPVLPTSHAGALLREVHVLQLPHVFPVFLLEFLRCLILRSKPRRQESVRGQQRAKHRKRGGGRVSPGPAHIPAIRGSSDQTGTENRHLEKSKRTIKKPSAAAALHVRRESWSAPRQGDVGSWHGGRGGAPLLQGKGCTAGGARPSAGAYQVVAEGLQSGLHNHVLHGHHLLLDGPFLHLTEQLQDDSREQKIRPQQRPSPSPLSHSAPTSRSTECTQSH